MTSCSDARTAQDPLLGRVRALGLFGLVSRWNEVQVLPWIHTLLEYEEAERTRRSLARRERTARLGSFKPIADFDWDWPRRLDRESIEDLFTLQFLKEGFNAVLIGQNGVGKTMILKNLAHQALVQGHTVRFTTASDMLADLAAQESSLSLTRRLHRFCGPALLCVDEVGYLSYDNRYADLLFEVVSRRYQSRRSIILTTNKVFDDWSSVFPNAACVVTLIDRLVHRCEQIEIDADSYRLKEAKAHAATKAKVRAGRRNPRKQSDS